MNCPKCNFFVEEGTLCCPKCGASVCAEACNTEELEKTMAIPVVRTTGKAETVNNVRQTPPSKPKTEQTEVKPKRSTGRWQSFVIAFLITALVCMSVALVYVLLTRETLPKAVDTESNIAYTKPNDDKIKEEKNEELKEGESVGVDDEVYGVRIDRDYPFKKGVSLKGGELSYKTLKGSDYQCDVPAGFEFVYENDGEIRYASNDGAAYMDIASFENKSSLSITQIKEKALEDIGGSQLFSETGDNRYSVTIERDGIIYHHKCILSGDNIVYYELVYPNEYSEVYDVYVSDIDETFDIAG